MTTGPLHATAYAKINLALHVRARRPDGYHQIETLFAFCEDGDGLTAAPGDALSLTITGRFAPDLDNGADNLVLAAARMLAQTARIGRGATFALDKRLPVAAGIGGGSADAAAALRLAMTLWAPAMGEKELIELAGRLGADVPACVASRTAVGGGIGDELMPVDCGVSGLPVLLVNPLVACPTGPVFRAWDGVDRGPLDPVRWREGRNDLEAPALALVPEIGAVLTALRARAGVTLARMSGSGASCFALFADGAARDAATSVIRAAHPGWWTMASRLR